MNDLKVFNVYFHYYAFFNEKLKSAKNNNYLSFFKCLYKVENFFSFIINIVEICHSFTLIAYPFRDI